MSSVQLDQPRQKLNQQQTEEKNMTAKHFQTNISLYSDSENVTQSSLNSTRYLAITHHNGLCNSKPNIHHELLKSDHFNN